MKKSFVKVAFVKYFVYLCAQDICLNMKFMESLMITQIPNDDSLESIKIREGIIRDFYREWKEINDCWNTSKDT